MLDASAVAAWFVPGQGGEASEALLAEAESHEFEVPHIFAPEVRSVFLKAERRGRMSESETARALAMLARFNPNAHPSPDHTGYDDILGLARRERLSVYDAIYLAQAWRSAAALATRDARLIAAGAGLGVEMLDLRG